MSSKARLQRYRTLTSAVVGLVTISALAVHAGAAIARPLAIAEGQDSAPGAAKESPEEAKKKKQQLEQEKIKALQQRELEQERAKADALKQKQLEQERAKAEALKPKQLEQERATREAEKLKAVAQDKAKALKQKQLNEERTKTEALRKEQQGQERAKADALKQKQLEQERAKAEALKQRQLEGERAKREAEKLKAHEQDKAKADALKQKQFEEQRARAEDGKRKQLEQEKAKAEVVKQKQLQQEKAKAEALKSKPSQLRQQPVTETNTKAAEQLRQDRAKADEAFLKAKEEARKEREQIKAARVGAGDKAVQQRQEAFEKKFEALRQQRHERIEEGGKRIVIEEPDKRRIVRQAGHISISHDETERLRHLYGGGETTRHGTVNENVIVRPGGVRIFTDFDDDGHVLRRYRRDPDGREYVFFDDRGYYHRARRGSFLDAIVDLAPPVILMPRERYIVDYDQASDDDLYDALSAPPVEPLERTYSLEEIRYSRYLRERMPRIDLDTITFDFGSWEVEPEEYDDLQRLAHVMTRVIDRNPDEMFLVEGHTDAVGSDEDNLSLSDRRAEAVAEVLSQEFGIPAENLVTQGYGEQFLKINTPGPERANRRVAIRRITPLLTRLEDR